MNRYWIVLAMILVLATAARFHGLAAKSLWLDEALSWRLQSFPIGTLIARTGESTTVHPPLYFVLLQQWVRLSGDSEFWLRAPSAAAGIFTVLAMFGFVYELARFWAGDSPTAARDAGLAGLLAAALLAVNGFHVYLGHQVRGYTLGIWLAVLTSQMLLRALRLGSVRPWVVYACLALAFCYTHTLALFTLAAQGYFAGMYLLSSGPARREEGDESTVPGRPAGACADGGPVPLGARRWTGPVLAAAVIVAGYLPWLPNTLSQSETLRTSWRTGRQGVQDHVNELSHALLFTSATHASDEPVLAWCVVVVLAGALTLGVARCGWAGLHLVCLGCLPVLLIFAYSQFSERGIFSARYFAFAQPAWLAALACAVVWLPLRGERAVLAGMLLLWGSFSYVEAYPVVGPAGNPGMRAAAAHILEHRRDDELVVSVSAFEFFKLAYYLRHATPPLLCVNQRGRENQRGTAQLVDSDLVTQEDIFQRQPQGLWIVTSNSYGGAVGRIVLPEGWEVVDQREYDQDFWLERPLQVRHCRLKSALAEGGGE